MAVESNENKPNQVYHLYAQMSKTFFSYKKPADGKAYAFVNIMYHDGKLTLRFKRGITSENVLDLTCYLSPAKAYDTARLLEGIMGRRREAYPAGCPAELSAVLWSECEKPAALSASTAKKEAVLRTAQKRAAESRLGEELPQQLREKMSQPEIATDIGKLTDLQKELDAAKDKAEEVELAWTEAAEKLEEFDQQN